MLIADDNPVVFKQWLGNMEIMVMVGKGVAFEMSGRFDIVTYRQVPGPPNMMTIDCAVTSIPHVLGHGCDDEEREYMLRQVYGY